MKRIEVEFIRGKNKDLSDRDLVIQTAWPQIVGQVSMFSRKDKGEERRRAFLENRDPYSYGKASGYRVYVTPVGMMGKNYFVENWKEQVHEILGRMAQFYAENITEGMQREYADADE